MMPATMINTPNISMHVPTRWIQRLMAGSEKDACAILVSIFLGRIAEGAHCTQKPEHYVDLDQMTRARNIDVCCGSIFQWIESHAAMSVHASVSDIMLRRPKCRNVGKDNIRSIEESGL